MTPNKHLLMAEDDISIADLLMRSMALYLPLSAVVHVQDGAEALDYLCARGKFQDRDPGDYPAMVLLDLSMPRVSGLEALRQIKENPELRHIPVVIMTSSSNPEDIQACYEEGANAYVVKPVDAREFRKAVEQTILFWMTRNEAPSGHVHNAWAAFAAGGVPERERPSRHDRNEKTPSHSEFGR